MHVHLACMCTLHAHDPAGNAVLPKAVDRFGPEVLSLAWSDLSSERSPFMRKQGAMRALAALAHASLTSKPGVCACVFGDRSCFNCSVLHGTWCIRRGMARLLQGLIASAVHHLPTYEFHPIAIHCPVTSVVDHLHAPHLLLLLLCTASRLSMLRYLRELWKV